MKRRIARSTAVGVALAVLVALAAVGMAWLVAAAKPDSDGLPAAILASGLLLAGLILAFAVSRQSYERRLVEAHRAERVARERATFLERHASGLVLATTEHDVAEHTTSDLVRAGVDAAAFYVRRGDRVHLLAEAGDARYQADAWAEPAAREAISTGVSVEHTMPLGAARAPRHGPGDEAARTATVLAAAIPTPAAGRARGVVVASASARELEDTRLLVAGVAGQCGVALERARLDALRHVARRRTVTLQSLGARLSEAMVPADVAERAVATLAQALDPDLAVAGIEGPDGLEVRVLRLELGVGHVPVEALSPVTAWLARGAVADAGAVEAHGAAQIAAVLGPEAAAELEHLGVLSLILMPLRHEAGYLGMLFKRIRVLGAAERQLLEEISERVTSAVERTSLFSLEQDARRRAERLEASVSFVSLVSEQLERATTAKDRAKRLTDLLTESVASFSAVHLVDDAGAELVAQSGRAPGRDDEPLWIAGVRAAVAAGKAQVFDSPAFDAASSQALVLPLTGRNGPIGALTVWIRGEGGPEPLPSSLADEIASRAAVLLDNALLYEHERDASHALQLGLLGGKPPSFDGVDVNGTYRAGTAALEVGGDWYDAFPLPSGAIGLVVGDVVGHGLEAAVAMGQLRGAVSALARSYEPAALLERLDEFVENVPSALAATLAYAQLFPDGELRYACAGHPPPLVVGPDGATDFLWEGRSAPLGSVLGGARTGATGRLREGEMLLLYTDGLVERRDERLDVGLARLERAATLHAGGFEALGQEVLDALLKGRPQDDDACILAARRASSSALFRHAFVASPSELRGLRDHLRTWLGANGVDQEATWGAVLAVSEAAANAIEHGYDSDGVGVVTVAGRLRDGALSLTVRDAGGWRDEHAPGDRGRGLPMMESVLDELAVERAANGTLVRMRQGTRAETMS